MTGQFNRRRFLRLAAGTGIGAAGLLSGCGRFGFTGASELPPREEEGLLSREPDSLYAPHGRPGEWFNPWWRGTRSPLGYYRMRLFYRNEWWEAKRP